MRSQFTRLAVLLIAIVGIGASVAFARMWSDKTGSFKVEAEFVSFASGKVKLQKADGKVVEVAMAKLSAADQKWVRDELKRRKAEETAATRNTGSESSGGRTVAKMQNEDWYQWRGPRRDGISLETGLLDQWPEEGPPKLWSSNGLGAGYSSVSISGDRIYTMGNKDGGVKLFCLKLEDGSIEWATPVGGGSDRIARRRSTLIRDLFTASRTRATCCARRPTRAKRFGR